MRYADTLLADGERIELRTRQHWLALIIDARHAVAFWVITVVSIIVAVAVRPTDAPATALGYVILITFVVGLLLFLYRAWQYYAQDFLITNRRVMRVEGVLNKQALDSSLEKVNDAELTQSIFGRLLGYGNLEILTAAEAAIDHFHLLRDPVGFKKTMLEAKHELELEVSGATATPPLRAQVLGAPGPAPAGAAADEITRTLAQLGTLRDQGTITPAEFEAKKQELLGRL